MKKILVLCTGNSCRSQMAQGYLATFLTGKADVYSAGTRPQGINPNAAAAMLEEGIDISGNGSNHVDEYADIDFDYVITVCDNAKEACPLYPKETNLIHHSFPDPADATGTPEEIMAEFREVRGMIKDYCDTFSKENFG